MAIRIKDSTIAQIKEEDGVTVVGNMTEFFGNSTDTKPTTNLVNGSTFVEVDTGDLYLFNEATSSWVKVE